MGTKSGPFPGWPEYVDQEAFHESGRHVDQQPGDPPLADGLQVLTDRMQRPAIHEFGLRLEDMPEMLDECVQPVLALKVLLEVAAAGFLP